MTEAVAFLLRPPLCRGPRHPLRGPPARPAPPPIAGRGSVAAVGLSAAFFDLDRTLLRTSSTPAISAALFYAGLVDRRDVPGQSLVLGFYDRFGETLPSMALARAAALAQRGWAVEAVAAAAEVAAERLEGALAPHAWNLIERERSSGRLLVLATTTPEHLVRPFAQRMGFDDVVATRYATATDEEGVERFTGRLAGRFVWSRGKLDAVRAWVAARGVDLASSSAFSDSVYDLPLLRAVGHPSAVNPDIRLQALATLWRWPILYLDAPPGVTRLFGVELMDIGRLALQQFPVPLARFDLAGTQHIPRSGPAIVVSNHRSYFDPVAWVMTVFEAGRNPRSLGKKEVLDAPVIGQLARAAGTIRVDRDGRGNEAYHQAVEALRGGEVVLIAPQGTIPRGEAFFDPVLRGKTGAARLAAATGAPVIPMGVWGTERVWPRSSRLPDPAALIRRPKVRVRVGPPVQGLTGTDFHRDTERIMEAITDLLPPEARQRRTPTAEELARTLPPR
jgi:putative phosphoserine phosphatase/1-acylglycerol-3-phosphate O-acyltransferase